MSKQIKPSKLVMDNGVPITEYCEDMFRKFQEIAASMFNKIDVCDIALKYLQDKIDKGDTTQEWQLYIYEYKELQTMAYMGARHIGGLKGRIEDGRVTQDLNDIMHLIGLEDIKPIDPIKIRTPLSFHKPICSDCKKMNNVDFVEEILFDPEVHYEEEHLRYYNILTGFIQDVYSISGGGLWYINEAQNFAKKNRNKLTDNELKFFRAFISNGTASANFAYVARECFAQNIITQHEHFNIKKPKEVFMNAYMMHPPEAYPDGVYIINEERLCKKCTANLRKNVVEPLLLTEDDIL